MTAKRRLHTWGMLKITNSFGGGHSNLKTQYRACSEPQLALGACALERKGLLWIFPLSTSIGS